MKSLDGLLTQWEMAQYVSTRSGKLESQWTTVCGLKMHARVSDERPSTAGRVPVVLVHGLIVSSLYMMPTAERLAPFYRVFALDLPGFGQSDKPERAFDVSELAGALDAWMDAAGLERAVLVGNSMGCQIIAEMAARNPHRVAGAVLTGPTVDLAARTRREQFKRLLIDVTRERWSLVLIQLRGLYDAGLRRSWQTSEFTLEDRIEEKLPHLQAPALVIRGTRDPIAPQAWVEQVVHLLPRGRLAVIPEGAHALNYSSPDELVILIREFIEREIPAA
jgi:pimeloyl-ACP methyl ester carboxylesterase